MSLADRLSAYLSDLQQEVVAVEQLSRIPGGASRETYRFDAVTRAGQRGMILRRDPPNSLIDTDRRLEYLAYQSFHPLGIPTPEPIALEEGTEALDRPFFLMSRVDGGAAASPFAPDPYGPHADAIGEQFFTILGRIAAADPSTLPLGQAAERPTPNECWRRELGHWERELDKDELFPQPIARAAARWLRRHQPPPAQKISVVHGDYRSGNFMHDGDGRILAILDWEMCHLGDPLEDLAWAIDPLWCHFETDRVSGMLPRDEAVGLWERASGLTVDPNALDWWQMFNSFKGLVIWISAAKAYRDGGGRDPVLGFSGWYTARRHDVIIAERLLAMLDRAA